MNLNPTEIAVIGTLGGTFIGGLFTAVATFINKQSEEKYTSESLLLKQLPNTGIALLSYQQQKRYHL